MLTYALERTPLDSVQVWEVRDLEACTFNTQNDTSQQDGDEEVKGMNAQSA